MTFSEIAVLIDIFAAFEVKIMVKTTDSGHQNFTFVLFHQLLAENLKKSAEKKTYEVYMTGVSVFSDPPCISLS